MLGYRAQSNFIYTACRVSHRRSNAFVGEASVLDIDTAMGNDTQLGHASSLQSGQRVPDGKRWHGSPAIETTADYVRVEPVPCDGAAPRPLRGRAVLAAVPARRSRCRSSRMALWDEHGGAGADTTGWWTLAGARPSTGPVSVSLVSFFGSIVTGLAGVWAVPRLAPPVPEGRQGLLDLRHPRLAAGPHREVLELAVLQRAVRRLARRSSATCASSAGT